MLFFNKRKQLIKAFERFRKDALAMYGIEPDDSNETLVAFLTMGDFLQEEKVLDFLRTEEHHHYNIITKEYEENAY